MPFGDSPASLSSPVMDEGVWNLIQICWARNPSECPTMEQIVAARLLALLTETLGNIVCITSKTLLHCT